MKKEFLNLGKQPIANGFLYQDDIKNEFFYDLKIGFDEETKLVTHMRYVDPPLMFNENYAYRGSMSKTMVSHFKELSDYLKLQLPQFPFYKRNEIKVLEIGSNDGVFIKNWDFKHTVAVEPCGNFASETNNAGYKTYNSFWDTKTSEKITKEVGKRDLIFAANCICHIPDLDSVFSNVRNTLNENGVFIFEDPSLAEMLNRNSYDQIYDEHSHIFSVTALSNLLKRNGMSIIQVDNISVHGGSNRIWAQRTEDVKKIDKSVKENIELESILELGNIETFERWTLDIEKSKTDLLRLLKNLKSAGKKVIGYGASSKSTTIFNYSNISKDLIEYIIDTTPEKQGKLAPGTHIPVVSPEVGWNSSVDYAYLGAWNFIEEIKNKESEFIKRGGKFITHVPKIMFI